VLDGDDGDQAPLVVNAVDHAVIAAPGAVEALQAELQRLAGRQAWMIEVPWTVILTAASGRVAGPFTTEPLTALYLLPWHGQSMVPPPTWSTMQPWWVQMAVNAWKAPAVGWVITIFWVVRILPPPTGMSVVVARTLDAAPPPDKPPPAGDEDAPPWGAAGGPASPLLVP
jgi:hypothetical protein